MTKRQLRKLIREEIKKIKLKEGKSERIRNSKEYEKGLDILNTSSAFKKITTSYYPASEASDILINSNDITPDVALVAFVDWAEENDILYNLNNF